jgi:hypothetical protein
MNLLYFFHEKKFRRYMSNYAYVGAGGHNMIRSSSISLLKIAA